MLCLSRRRGEEIRIGEDVIVKVLEIRPDGVVRLGIDCPKEIPIFRSEVAPPREGKGDGKGGAA